MKKQLFETKVKDGLWLLGVVAVVIVTSLTMDDVTGAFRRGKIRCTLYVPSYEVPSDGPALKPGDAVKIYKQVVGRVLDVKFFVAEVQRPVESDSTPPPDSGPSTSKDPFAPASPAAGSPAPGAASSSGASSSAAPSSPAAGGAAPTNPLTGNPAPGAPAPGGSPAAAAPGAASGSPSASAAPAAPPSAPAAPPSAPPAPAPAPSAANGVFTPPPSKAELLSGLRIEVELFKADAPHILALVTPDSTVKVESQTLGESSVLLLTSPTGRPVAAGDRINFPRNHVSLVNPNDDSTRWGKELSTEQEVNAVREKIRSASPHVVPAEPKKDPKDEF